MSVVLAVIGSVYMKLDVHVHPAPRHCCNITWNVGQLQLGLVVNVSSAPFKEPTALLLNVVVDTVNRMVLI